MSDAAQSQNVSPMPTRASHAPLGQVKNLQDAFDHPMFMSRLKQAVPKHMSPDRMLAVFVQSVQKTPKLRDCNIMSLLGAFLSVASVGLEPNTALGHAYLIPVEKRGKNPTNGKWETQRVDVQVIFGYQGLLELAYRSGLVRSVHADVAWPDEVTDREHWECWYGTGGKLIHRPRLGVARPEGTMPALAYMHANLKGEGEAFEVMPMSDVIRIRNATQAYQTALRAKGEAESKGWANVPATYTEAPWVKHPIAMIRKTVFRAGSKWLPKSIELASALALDELQDRRRANFGAVIEGSADVLTTGLDALPDETAEHMDMGLGGDWMGGAAPLDPGRYAEAAQGSPPPQQERAQTAAKPAAAPPQPKAAPPAAPAFEAYLVDEVGEVIGDLYTSPELFAQALIRLDETTPAAGRDQLWENNGDAIGMARALSDEAARNLADAQGTAPPAAPQEATAQADPKPDLAAAMPLTRNGRGPDVTGWVKGAVAAIATMDEDVLRSWVANNEATFRAFPAPRRLEIGKALAARCQALGIPPVSGLPAAAPAAAPAAGQLPLGEAEDDQQWSYEVEGEIGRLTDEAGLNALVARIKTRAQQVKGRDPAAYQRVDEALAGKQKALGLK